jgi:hypothetical protein
MIETIPASALVVGDILANNGAIVEQTVLCGHGSRVYIRAELAPGEMQVETVSADLAVPVWRVEI